ncbi:MAG: PhzF family phenazine biosynthesis protein [Bdellovibrionales bacterium]
MVKTYKFALVDAFAETPLAGNPCAVVLDADSLSSGEMRKIAKEMNQSETAFLMPSNMSDLKARYFTPEREIPLAGHPTIASVHAAIEVGMISVGRGTTALSLELNDGPIKVEIERTERGNWIRMFQRKPQFGEIHEPSAVLPLFGLKEDDLLDGAPIQTVSTGTRQLMVAVKGLDSLKRLSMNVDLYKKYRTKMNFFSPHIFCLNGVTPEGNTFARHLGVPPDTLEDAFTGSATGGMAAFLWKHDLIKQPRFIAEQGHWMDRPGKALVEVIGPRDNIEAVTVSGPAVTVVTGSLRIS